MMDGVLLLGDLSALPGQLGTIFYHIVLPMLLIIAIGFTVQRQLGLDMKTMVRLNFYFIVPAIIYYVLVTSELKAGDVGTVVGFHVAMILILGALTWLAGALRGTPRDQRTTMMMATMFYNSGNYGMPMQDLAFRSAGLGTVAMGLQAFVMVTQNFVSFTLGILIASSGSSRDRHWKENLLHIVKFPPLYALAAALITMQVRSMLSQQQAEFFFLALGPFWSALGYIKSAFIAIALVTLGAQLAVVKHEKQRRYPVSMSVLLRLLLGPVLGLAMIYLFGISDPFVAQVLLISTATPTAVNAMLLCMEFDAHPNFIARSVFYSTLLSPITVTLTIFLAQSGLLARLTAP